MNIILGDNKVPIITVIGRADVIDGARREIIELQSEQPLSAEDIEYIKTHDSFTNDIDGKYDGFTDVVRHSVWLAQVDPNAVVVKQINAEKEALAAEKAALIVERDKLVAALPTLLEGKSEEIALQFKEYLPEVKVEQPIVEEPIVGKI